MSSAQQQAVTLPVNNLHASTAFYISALQPLGYCLISKVQHKTTTSSFESIGLGPSNTNRVDVFLSEAGRSAHYSKGRKTAHIVFPAPSRAAVRDCYTAALYAGGKALESPNTREDGVFAAIFTDVDENKVEVCFSVPNSRAASTQDDATAVAAPVSQRSKTIETWRDDVAESVAQSPAPGSYPSGRLSSSAPTPSASTEARTTYYPVPAKHQRALSFNSGTPDDAVRQTARRLSIPAASPRDIPGNKGVVGALLGAAAGAAVAYAVVRSREDGKQKEADFDARMATRDRVKAEARSHAADAVTDGVPGLSRPKNRSGIGTTRASDRDSGYYSAESSAGMTTQQS